MKLLKVLSILCLIGISHVGYSASINPVSAKNIVPVASPVLEKAIQDKRIKGDSTYDQKLKDIKSFNSAPTQNFFAHQNQQFSIFIQSFFSQIGS